MTESESKADDIHLKLLPHGQQNYARKTDKEMRELLQEVRVIVEEIRQFENDPVSGYYPIKKIWRMYNDTTLRPHRKEIGDVLSECCYSTCTNKMLKRLMIDGYYPQSCWGWFMNMSLWSVTTFVFDNASNFSDVSEELATDLAKDNVLELMQQNLELYTDITPRENSYNYFIIHASLSIIYNIARRPQNKPVIKKYNFSPHLQRFRLSEDDVLRVSALSALAFITEVKDSMVLFDDGDTIAKIIEWMEEAIEKEEHEEIMDDNVAAKLVNVLNKLSIKENAQTVVDGRGLIVLGKMLNSSDIAKRVGASNCLCTLAFHDEIKQDITNDGELMKTITTLERIETNVDLLKNVKGTLWLLSDDDDRDD